MKSAITATSEPAAQLDDVAADRREQALGAEHAERVGVARVDVPEAHRGAVAALKNSPGSAWGAAIPIDRAMDLA
jgi:hypothetical protein